jgi:hypothetical protein
MTINHSAFCIHDFCMILGLNGDYPLDQHSPADLCHGELRFSRWGTQYFLKYYKDASHAALPISNSSKLPPVVDAADLFSKLSIKQSQIQNSAVCLKPHNVFTFTLFLPEGWAGVAWEPSNKMMLFLPPRKIKCLSLHPLISSLNLLFIFPSHLSLSRFGFKGWRHASYSKVQNLLSSRMVSKYVDLKITTCNTFTCRFDYTVQ